MRIPHRTSTVYRSLSDRLNCWNQAILTSYRFLGVGNLEGDNSLQWPHFSNLSSQTTSDTLLEVRWGIFIEKLTAFLLPKSDRKSTSFPGSLGMRLIINVLISTLRNSYISLKPLLRNMIISQLDLGPPVVWESRVWTQRNERVIKILKSCCTCRIRHACFRHVGPQATLVVD